MNRARSATIGALGAALAAKQEPEAQRYWRENGVRIAANLDAAVALCERHPVRRVLDVGPSFQTVILQQLLPHIALETMGWEDHRYRPSGDTVHHRLDLNDTANAGQCALPPPVDLILLLEVIEHLHTSPRHVLRYLYRCLNPGGFLIVSTPNAAFLRNRLQLLAGSNPFEPIREDAMNPGHFREYTRRELAGHCRECGFDVLEARVENLFCYGPGSGRLFSAITRWLPADFRRDITIIAQRPGQPGNET